jgi:hypothetical protein
MNTPRLVATGQQILSLALSATLTLAVLLSLSAQADEQHAAALAQRTQGAQLCATQPVEARS